MVKSNLHFEKFDQGSLTGWAHRLDRVVQTCEFWVSTYTSCFVANLECQKIFIKNFFSKNDD
jgi:hypothetical protein